jgi:hypothetical protein
LATFCTVWLCFVRLASRSTQSRPCSGNQVAVDVNGCLDRGVAELLFDEGGRDPLLDQDGRVGMAQGVRGQLAQAGLGE